MQQLLFMNLDIVKLLLPEKPNNVCPIWGWNIVKWHVIFCGKSEALRRDIDILVNLVGGEQGGDVGAVLAQLSVPGGQVLVGHL